MSKQEMIDTLKRIASGLTTLRYPTSNAVGEMYVFLDAIRQTVAACEDISAELAKDIEDDEGLDGGGAEEQ